MDKRQRVKDYIKRTGTTDPERIRSALYNGSGGPVRTAVIREVLAQVRGPIKPAAPTIAVKTSVKTRSLSEFRSEYDYALKLKRAIGDLGEGYVDEHAMKTAAGIPNHVWRRYADLPEFASNKLKLRDVTYWARPKVIESMKEIVGLA